VPTPHASCVCEAGFAGAACEHLDACAGESCLNAGVCLQVGLGRIVALCHRSSASYQIR
jgi:hypothetical protein